MNTSGYFGSMGMVGNGMGLVVELGTLNDVGTIRLVGNRFGLASELETLNIVGTPAPSFGSPISLAGSMGLRGDEFRFVVEGGPYEIVVNDVDPLPSEIEVIEVVLLYEVDDELIEPDETEEP